VGPAMTEARGCAVRRTPSSASMERGSAPSPTSEVSSATNHGTGDPACSPGRAKASTVGDPNAPNKDTLRHSRWRVVFCIEGSCYLYRGLHWPRRAAKTAAKAQSPAPSPRPGEPGSPDASTKSANHAGWMAAESCHLASQAHASLGNGIERATRNGPCHAVDLVRDDQKPYPVRWPAPANFDSHQYAWVGGFVRDISWRRDSFRSCSGVQTPTWAVRDKAPPARSG